MAKTTNILDLNNRLTKVEKENVAQNSYISLKNKPKINNVTLTGNKSSSDFGLAAAGDILFGDLPSNGFDPLTQCSGFFCYSVYPDKMALQGCPNNYSNYGTIFGCSGTRYKLLVYIDINGKFAILSQGNEWVTYSS